MKVIMKNCTFVPCTYIRFYLLSLYLWSCKIEIVCVCVCRERERERKREGERVTYDGPNVFLKDSTYHARNRCIILFNNTERERKHSQHRVDSY